MRPVERLAEHFNEPVENFKYRPVGHTGRPGTKAKRGWFYKNEWLGKSLRDIKESTYWALHKLPGRDTF